MSEQIKKRQKAKSAEEFVTLFCRDSENQRLYRESEIRFRLSERMTEMRKKRKLSQEELAHRVGCRQPFIAKLEGGAYDRCEISTLRTFASAMGYDIAIEEMFRPIARAHFTGNSSAAVQAAAPALQGALSDRLAGISLARWDKEQVTSVPPRKGRRMFDKEKSAAA